MRFQSPLSAMAAGVYDRTFSFYIPKSTVLALGNDLVTYMNARSEGADSVDWQEFPSGNIYTAAFHGVSWNGWRRSLTC